MNDELYYYVLMFFLLINSLWCVMWGVVFAHAMLCRDGIVVADINAFGEGWLEVFILLSVAIVGAVLVWEIAHGMVCE